MRSWLLLSAAIVAEVIGTLSLRATVDHRGWIALVAAGYLAAFIFLGLTLGNGQISIGVVYGIWGAAGVALVAILGALVFNERLNIPAMIGIAVIIAGVLIVETGTATSTSSDGPDTREETA